MSSKPPDDLVLMGRVAAPFGVKGWIKIRPFTAAAENLLSYATWWLGDGAEWREHRVVQARVRGELVVAKVEGCDDRDAAAGIKGKHVALRRAVLPQLAPNEFYWTDLIGLQVINSADEELGRVVRILRTGANDVLVVEGERERLIPFIADVIRNVDIPRRVIEVEWGADY